MKMKKLTKEKLEKIVIYLFPFLYIYFWCSGFIVTMCFLKGIFEISNKELTLNCALQIILYAIFITACIFLILNTLLNCFPGYIKILDYIGKESKKFRKKYVILFGIFCIILLLECFAFVYLINI